ncbi:MAG: TrkH family potassium uptake protein [Calditrichia bacterium]
MRKLYILHYLGNIGVVIGILMLIPALVSFIARDYSDLNLPVLTFLGPSGFAILTGLLMHKHIPARNLSTVDAMMLTVFSYVLLSLLSSTTFVLGIQKSWIDAFFESVSGITASGLTVFTGLDDLPRGILFWRSMLQWLGGLGILTFFLAVSFKGSSVAFTLFGAEGNKISNSRPVPGIHNTIKILWMIYGGFTLAAILLFYASGMSFFDALNHSFTCVSTGGYSTHDASIGYFAQTGFANYRLIEYITILFMTLGGINFMVHYQFFTGKMKVLFTDFEIRYFWKIIIFFVILIMIDYLWHSASPVSQLSFAQLEEIFRKTLFQVIALITSSGFSTQDINSPFFPALSKIVFIVLMVVGGCAGSTSGGFKVMRVAVFFKMIKNEIFRMVAPRSAINDLVIRKQMISRSEVERIGTLFFLWIAIILFGAGITAIFSDLTPWQSLSGSVSALGTMGPHFFSVDQMSSLHWVIKLTYSFSMIAGRIEIIPILVLFSKTTWK